MKIELGKALRMRKMTQAALADAIPVSRGYISDIVSGKKLPSPTTIAKICEVLEISPGELFGDVPVPKSSPVPGFSEDDAKPFVGQAAPAQIVAVMDRKPKSPSLYTLLHDAPAFSLLAGDVLALDLNATARPNDIVLATEVDDNGNAATRIYRLASPWLLPASPSQPAIMIDTSGRFAILGVVVGSLRGGA